MKKTDQDIETLVEKTLSAFDGADRARPKPFLFTRIIARKEKSLAGSYGFISPVIQHVGLAFIIMIIAFNIYTATTIFRNSVSNASLEENENAFVEDLYPSTPTLDNLNLTTSNP
ncbi:MAG: hypothetical protein PVH48_05090 [Cyclobacteriaceae bacterium]|jgi:hypothetical protein